ncbi:MAG TPA: hypothetical protein VKG24_20545 [Pseudolabrys sp.]|nr:hypothetical protein [Pseudolabrys sp.]
MTTQRYWKLERSGELSAAEVAAAVGAGGHVVLRTDVAKGKTTIYFTGGSEDEQAKAVRAHAKKIKLADVIKL